MPKRKLLSLFVSFVFISSTFGQDFLTGISKKPYFIETGVLFGAVTDSFEFESKPSFYIGVGKQNNISLYIPNVMNRELSFPIIYQVAFKQLKSTGLILNQAVTTHYNFIELSLAHNSSVLLQNNKVKINLLNGLFYAPLISAVHKWKKNNVSIHEDIKKYDFGLLVGLSSNMDLNKKFIKSMRYSLTLKQGIVTLHHQNRSTSMLYTIQMIF